MAKKSLQVTLSSQELLDFLRLDDSSETATLETLKQMALDEAVIFLNTDFSVITTIVDNLDGTITTTVDNGDGEPPISTTTDGSNNGTTTTTSVPQEAPGPVKLWVMNRVVQYYENRGMVLQPDYRMLQPYRVYPFN